MRDSVQILQGSVDAVLADARAFRITGDEDVAEVEGVLQELAVVEAQLASVRLTLLGEAQLAGMHRVADQVQQSSRVTRGKAREALLLGGELASRFWILGDALAEGVVSEAQVSAMVHGLKRIPGHIGQAELEHCQQTLLGMCDALGPAELRQAALHLWEVVDPEGAEDVEAARLLREERRAKAGRAFRLTPNRHGSMRISGQLPVADGAVLASQLEALMPPASSYANDGDFIPTPDARRADALMHLVAIAASAGEVPEQGGDRPHIQITMPLGFLTDKLGRAELLGFEGEQVSAQEARRLACDAGLIPVVLGSKSEPLDVGRERRLVTRALRAALVHRDRGCVFPHCTAKPAACEAHHIVPWWAGGETSLANMVLLCPHHHRLVEPDPNYSAEGQWQIHITSADTDLVKITSNGVSSAGGRPVFVPPRYLDPARSPRQHRRFTLDDITARPPADGELCPKPAPTTRRRE